MKKDDPRRLGVASLRERKPHELSARRLAQPLRPHEGDAGSEDKDLQRAFEREAFPSVDRLTQRIHCLSGLDHDLDQFLKDAKDDDEGEAGDDRLAQALGRTGQRGAQHGEQRARDDEDRTADRRPQTEGQGFQHSRGKGNENLAKRKELHPQGEEREKGARDAARKQAQECERPEC